MKAVYCVETGKEYDTMVEAAKDIGVYPQHIYAYLNGKTKTVKGYHFEYRDRPKPERVYAVTDGETWRKVDGFPDYSVSVDGQVRNDKTWRILSGRVKKYKRVTLTNGEITKHLQVHRLVATAFIPNPENKTDVNHKDGNGLNNAVSNLEWTTRSENMLHKCYVLDREPQMKAVLCVESGVIYRSQKAAARQMRGDHRGLRACLKGEQATWKGYHWKYAE